MSLRNINPTEAQLILSEITKSFMPSPYEVNDKQHSELYKVVLSEILESLNLTDAQIQPKDNINILSILHDEMKSISLDGEKTVNTKNRLGEKGNLDNSLYKIEFVDNMSKYNERGITEPEIRETVGHPDTFMHLHRGHEANAYTTPISIYLKSFNQGSQELILLVETVRKGDTQQISTAWKIFPDDIGLHEKIDPLNLLKKFVDVYGTEFRIGNTLPQKFILYEVIPIFNKNKQINSNFPFDIKVIKGDGYIPHSLYKISPLAVMEVSLAYVINITKYFHDLRKHGINAIEKKPN